MPPYLVLRDFLPEETVAGLLDFTLAHEADFKPTRTGRGEEGSIRPDSFFGRHARARAV